MSTAAASPDPGVVSCSEHDLPGADPDAVVHAVAVSVVPEVMPLIPLSKQEGSVLSNEDPDGAVEVDLLPVANHRAIRGKCPDVVSRSERAGVTLEGSNTQRREHGRAEQDLRRD